MSFPENPLPITDRMIGPQLGLAFIFILLLASSANAARGFLKDNGFDLSKIPAPLHEKAQTNACFENKVPFSENVWRWCEMAGFFSTHYDVDMLDVLIVIAIESGGDPNAVSSAGAQGLMQIMWEWHYLHLSPAEIEKFGAGVLFNPASNVRLGVIYFSELMDLYPGEPEAWFAAYNGGPNAGRWYSQVGSSALYGRGQYIEFLLSLKNKKGEFIYTPARAEAKANQVEIYVDRAMNLRRGWR
jgi:soluble lytic murein transglycosylase-like protein